MQFIANGPDIPETLLQAHEDGRVVFFCGAGISFPAGLPGFEGLTARIFDELGVEPTPPEEAAMAAGRFDVAIGLLEGRHVGGRVAVRRERGKRDIHLASVLGHPPWCRWTFELVERRPRLTRDWQLPGWVSRFCGVDVPFSP